MHNSEKPRLDPVLSQAMHQVEHRHLWRVVIFILIYGVAACGAYVLFSALGGAWWAFLVCFPLYLLAGASLHGISLFTHEGVHGVLSRHQGLNRAISMACAFPVLQTFAAYKVLHLQHHKHLGVEGDPDHYPNYTEWTPLIWGMHWGRLIIGYPAYITAIPILGFMQGNGRDRLWIGLEVSLLAGLVLLVLASPISGSLLLHAWLLPMLLINTMVNVRGMSQHTLLEHAADVIQGSRSLLTNKLVAFFMCNENYHLEHHLYPGVPWHNLPRLHMVLREELIERKAPYVASYSAFVLDFVRASLRLQPVGTVNVHAIGPNPATRPLP